jgi:hypothetical protein
MNATGFGVSGTQCANTIEVKQVMLVVQSCLLFRLVDEMDITFQRVS